MSSESSVSKEMPGRVGVRSAMAEYPDSTELLIQIEGLSKEAYFAIDSAVNLHKITFNDFALYQLDKKDLSLISELLSKLELAYSEEERRSLVDQIAVALLA